MGRITGSSEKKLFVKCRHEGSDQYTKVVEWSEEDQCYVGTCPGVMLGGIHGADEAKVYGELCQAVEGWIEIYQEDRDSLPESTSGKEYS